MADIEEKIKEYEHLVNYTIKRFFPSKLFDDDIKQIGMIALWQAIKKVQEPDFNNGTAQENTYIIACIKNQIIRELKKQQAQKRTDPNKSEEISLDNERLGERGIECNADIIGSDTIPYKLVGLKMYMEKKNKLQQNMINLLIQGYSMKEIAKMLNISKSKAYLEWKKLQQQIKMNVN